MDEIILSGIKDCEVHDWCADDICACKGAVCTDCLAVRETNGVTK